MTDVRSRCRRMLPALAVICATGCGDVTSSPSPPPELPVDTPAVPAGPYTPGQSYFGRGNYIEYVAGNSPVIYTAPHGGSLTPAGISERTAAACGESVVTGADLNTADLVRRIQQAHFASFGKYPHVIINHLHRSRLDANRPIGDGACGDAEAVVAWLQWHELISVARAAVMTATGKGWYMDIHGHGHSRQRLELGYLITGAQLGLTDAELDANSTYEDKSSIGTLSRQATMPFSEVLRGALSLGTLYASQGFRAVPSMGDPAPLSGDAYFTGGYNTAGYGCSVDAAGLGGMSGGTICGVQVEANFEGVRDNATTRQRFADATVMVVEVYLWAHFGITLAGGSP